MGKKRSLLRHLMKRRDNAAIVQLAIWKTSLKQKKKEESILCLQGNWL